MRVTDLVFGMTGAAGLGGGIASANLNVLETLGRLARESGARLSVLSLHESSEDGEFLRGEGVRFHGFRSCKAGYSRALVASYRPGALLLFDHVHIALPAMPLLACGLGKVVVFAHGSESWRRVRPVSKWLFRRAALCLTNSEYTLRRMRETFDGFRGEACPLGLTPRHPLNGEPPEPPVAPLVLDALDGVARPIGRRMLLLVARMDRDEREKGHDRLLEVWPRVLASHPRAQLVFAGDGNDAQRIAGRAREAAVAGSVFMPGFVPHDLLGELYRRCFAFVMPSLQEGFGLVYLEAMNYAKPCVGCLMDGAGEVIVDGETGYLLRDANDADALLGIVRRLLDDERRAARMGLRGFERLGARFTSGHAQERLARRLAALL